MGMDTLGQRIAYHRKAAKMSQAGLAKACGWSSQSRVGNYESGTREPTLADLEKIAGAVGVSVAALAYGDSSATPPEPARHGQATEPAVDLCDEQVAELLGKLRDAKKKASPRSQAVISRMIGLAEHAALDDAAWKLIDDLLTELSKK